MTVQRYEVNITLWGDEDADVPVTDSFVIQALIDTGSELNMIKTSCLGNKIRLNEKNRIKVRGVNNAISTTRGSKWCYIEFTDHSPLIADPRTTSDENPLFRMKFHVQDDSPVDVVIGVPFIRSFVSAIDFNAGRMYVCRNRRSLSQPAAIPMWTRVSNPQYSFIATEYDEQHFLDQKSKDLRSLEGSHQPKIKENQPGYSTIPINSKLPLEDQERFRNLLEQHSSLFDISTNEVSVFKYGDHPPLKLPLSSSVYSLPKRYDIPSALVPEFGKQLKSWTEGGVVVPQKKNVQYRNNIVCVKKADGTWRFCLDASMLNTIIAKENQVIPKISRLLHDVAGYSFYTTLDLSQFFLNFKLDDESSDLTTFFSPVDNLLYKFVRSPFGIRWSMSYAIRLCNEELSKIPNGSAFLRAYVDDILIFSPSLDEHFLHLKLVLKQLQICNFKIKPKKMKVAYPSADLFGYVIDRDGFTISPTRKEKLLSLKRPTSKKELQQVIGKLGYFRIIMGEKYPMAAIQAGFSDLLSGKNRFIWKESHDEAWDLVRKALHHSVKLTKLNEDDHEVIVRSDSSDRYFGATMSTMRHGKEVLIHCMSKMWTQRYIRQHITRKELMAALLAIEDFKFDLIGRKVEIQLDNVHAVYMLRNPDKAKNLSSRDVLWRLLQVLHEIGDYKVTKLSNKDSKFKLCDMLSRYLDRDDGPDVNIQTSTVKELLTIAPPTDTDEIYQSYVATEMALSNCLSNSSQVYYPTMKNISGLSNLSALNQLMKLMPEINHYMNENNLIEVPTGIRYPLVMLIHNICHFGNTRVISLLVQFKYKWRGMNRDVNNIVRSCKTCQRFKASNKKLQLTTTSNNALLGGEELAVDIKEIKGHHPINILVAIDVVTHYIEAIRIPGRLVSENIAKGLLIILSKIAPTCSRIKLDNDPKLKSRMFQDFLKTLGIKPIYGARLSSRSNSLIERSIGLLANQISYLKMENLPSTSWDVGISLATLFVNLSPRKTMGNLSPYELTFGKSIIFNDSIVKATGNITLTRFSDQLSRKIESLQTLKRIMPKQEYPRGAASLYKVGDKVRISITKPKEMARSLAPKWSSAVYKITEVKPQHMTYKVRNLDNEMDIRISHNRQTKKISSDNEDSEEDKFSKPKVSNITSANSLANDIRSKIDVKAKKVPINESIDDKMHEKKSSESNYIQLSNNEERPQTRLYTKLKKEMNKRQNNEKITPINENTSRTKHYNLRNRVESGGTKMSGAQSTPRS